MAPKEPHRLVNALDRDERVLLVVRKGTWPANKLVDVAGFTAHSFPASN